MKKTIFMVLIALFAVGLVSADDPDCGDFTYQEDCEYVSTQIECENSQMPTGYPYEGYLCEWDAGECVASDNYCVEVPQCADIQVWDCGNVPDQVTCENSYDFGSSVNCMWLNGYCTEDDYTECETSGCESDDDCYEFSECLAASCGAGGECVFELSNEMCDDSEECTVDVCNEAGNDEYLCSNTPVADETPCTGGTCQVGQCVLIQEDEEVPELSSMVIGALVIAGAAAFLVLRKK